MIDPLTTNGPPGAALCSFGRLRSSAESRRVEVLPNGDVRAERLMGSVQTWRSTTVPLRDDTILRLVSDDVVAAAPPLPASVAPAGGGVALATSAASPVGQPAASLPTATGSGASKRTGAHRSNGGDGESVGSPPLGVVPGNPATSGNGGMVPTGHERGLVAGARSQRVGGARSQRVAGGAP